MTPVLELAGVSKAYGALRPLRIEGLTIDSGESVAVVGLDAPAAETLINLVMGTVLPDAGQVVAFGRPTGSIADSREWLALADRFGMVSERAVLLDAMSVLQNLAIPFTLDVEPLPPDVRARAHALADLVELPEAVREAPVSSLDGAGRMRLHLGRALAHDPELVLLEHPTARVGSAARAGLGRLVRSVASRRGTAILALTADEEFARTVAARVLGHDPRTGALAPRRGWRVWPRRRSQ